METTARPTYTVYTYHSEDKGPHVAQFGIATLAEAQRVMKETFANWTKNLSKFEKVSEPKRIEARFNNLAGKWGVAVYIEKEIEVGEKYQPVR